MQEERSEPLPPELPWTSIEGKRWVNEVLARTGILAELRAALEQPIETHHTEIRLAAAAIWAVGCTETASVTQEDITHAIHRLRLVAQLPLFVRRAPEVGSLVDLQIASLEALVMQAR